MKQRQFLDVVDEDEARRRFAAATQHLVPRIEEVPLAHARGRVLASDARAPLDVPGFDRSNMDGFAVRAEDTFGATELEPQILGVRASPIAAGQKPVAIVETKQSIPIATGAVLPRGADAVVMVEHTLPSEETVAILHPVAPGCNVTGTGTDLARGEIVLMAGTRLGSRETGLLAAAGLARVPVHAQPRVAVISTGNEVRAPGAELAVGEVFDSNGRILCDAAIELGGAAEHLGILPDDKARLAETLRTAIAEFDLVLLSGGTSKGAGDLNARVVEDLARSLPDSPGILVHGVALKPGKPLCLAVLADTPVAILPGFPTSAIFTFHEFVAPILRRLAGRAEEARQLVCAVTPVRISSVPGRTEYQLVDLVPGRNGLSAYPLGSGSGSVRTFSRADGFVRIPRHEEFVPAGASIEVRSLGALGDRPEAADLIAIGSHCVGLDRLLSMLGARGLRTKMIPVGSRGGLDALARGEGDIAGTHLLDATTGVYNTPFLPRGVVTLAGYGRRQGFVHRRGDERFEGLDLDALRVAAFQHGTRMVNRNPGSGTRALLDRFLAAGPGEEPDGHHLQARSHHAVAAAVAQGRADWGFTLDTLAANNGLAFVFVQEERFDLVALEERLDRPGIRALRELLRSDEGRSALTSLGFLVAEPTV